MRWLRSELLPEYVETNTHAAVQRPDGRFMRPTDVYNLGNEIEVVWSDGERKSWTHSRRGHVIAGLVPIATTTDEFTPAWADTEVGRQVRSVFEIKEAA